MYQINVEFDDSATHQEVSGWLDTIVMPSLPERARATINLDEILRNVEDLTEDDIGSIVRFEAKNGLAVIGNLEAIYPGHHQHARVLVVHGVAHLLHYGVVRISS